MDTLIDGKIHGWPVSAQIMTNPGEQWVGLHVAAYTGENDESAPANVKAACESATRDYPNRREAMRALKATGFVAHRA
jgi:hypothetical protein